MDREGKEEGVEEGEGEEKLLKQNTALLQKNRTGIDYPAYMYTLILST